MKNIEFVKEFGTDLVEMKFLNFRKVVSKSMGDMRIGVIVSEVLLSPNVLERSPAWQVSSLKKKLFDFFVCSLLLKLGGPTLDKILLLFLTLFFNEKMKNLKICL